jgi:hypothetical protein
MTSPCIWSEYRPKYAAEDILNKIRHKYWWSFIYFDSQISDFENFYTFIPSPYTVFFSDTVFKGNYLYKYIFFCFWRDSPHWARAFSFTRFLDHTQRRTTVGKLLCPSDQLVADASTWQQTQNSQQKNVHTSGGVRTHNLSRRAAADLRLKPPGHWDRHIHIHTYIYIYIIKIIYKTLFA